MSKRILSSLIIWIAGNLLIKIHCKTGTEKTKITLLLRDGQSEEGNKGSHSQNWEEDTNNDEEFETLEPGSPVVLTVHDVCDESPER